MKKLLSLLAFGLVLSSGYAIYTAQAADFPRETYLPDQIASTTAYTLTWGATATRIVATSTASEASGSVPRTSGRSALTIQTTDCGANGEVWLQFNDKAAATSTGYWLNSSSTVTFADSLPMVYGSIKAMASTANCTLLVTEFRTRN